MNTAKIKSTLFEALDTAGKLIKKASLERQVIEKKTELSLVTETDKRAENEIVRVIKNHFPDHAFLTEESPPSGDSKSRWIIDPIDGTTNYAHTYPVAAVSIAYENNGTLLAGGVYDPFRDELFSAFKGEGAFLNNTPIKVSETPTLSEALLATGFPYDRRERLDNYLKIIKDFLMIGQGLRRSGAAAIDLCYIACGRLDAYWEFQLNAWDKAAAMLIIDEAGGKTTNYSGEPLTLDHTQNVATNGIIHDEVLKVLEPYKNWMR